MDCKELVSVIIPCYNHEKYISQAVDSVLNQSYKNIELIVVDDGSKDESPHIIEALSIKHGFTFINQENIGICKTLNKAIRRSKGEYVAILASDDYWHLEKVEKQVKCLKQNPNSQFSFTQAIEFDDSNNARHIRVFPAKPLSGKVLNKVFLRQHVPAGSILFSRKLYDKIAGFDENLKEEDWDFVIRCASETEFSVVKEPLFYYRSHSANIMKTRNRSEIFRQKALILSKNYHLVRPLRWLVAILIHFVYDNYALPTLSWLRKFY
ncbi:MAG: glycosyltransferase [Candidatus Riflebacteria bacterium]|nr:glycosyltransferase [Candidatus Riflebacteria bacterium]